MKEGFKKVGFFVFAVIILLSWFSPIVDAMSFSVSCSSSNPNLNSVTVFWSGGNPPYTLWRDNNPIASGISGTSYTDSNGLANNTNYNYHITEGQQLFPVVDSGSVTTGACPVPVPPQPQTATITVGETPTSGGTWTISPGGHTGTVNTVAASSSGPTQYCITSNTQPGGYSLFRIDNSVYGQNSACLNITPNSGESFTLNYQLPQSICGNGVVGAGEQCDNASQNGVVCNSPYAGSCMYCSSSSSPGGGVAACQRVTVSNGGSCGDGIIQNPPESCDDGNVANGDGCTSTCTVQQGYTCTGTPSVCTPTGAQCTFTSASWSSPTAVDGNTVSMNLVGNNCNGQAVNFFISEADCLGACSYTPYTTVSGTFPNTNWVATWSLDTGGSNPDPEYVYVAQLASNSSVQAQSGQLVVTQSGGGGPPAPPGNGSCVVTSAAWSTISRVQGQNVNLIVQGTNCSGRTVSFVVSEYDQGTSTDDPVVTNPVNVVFSGNTATGTWVSEWQSDGIVGDPEYYFNATVSGATGSPINSGTASNQLLTVTQSSGGGGGGSPCSNITVCGNYPDSASCGADACNVAPVSVPAGVNCSDPSVTCSCAWNISAGSCSAQIGGAAGTCAYSQQTTDDCADGFLSLSWTAQWTWFTGKGPADDPQGLHLQCVSGSKIVECPAQVALPFFSYYNVVIAIILIGLIYWVISLRKSSRKHTKK